MTNKQETWSGLMTKQRSALCLTPWCLPQAVAPHSQRLEMKLVESRAQHAEKQYAAMRCQPPLQEPGDELMGLHSKQMEAQSKPMEEAHSKTLLEGTRLKPMMEGGLKTSWRLQCQPWLHPCLRQKPWERLHCQPLPPHDLQPP